MKAYCYCGIPLVAKFKSACSKTAVPGEAVDNIIGKIEIVLMALEILRCLISKNILAIMNPRIISIVIELKAITKVFLIAVKKMSSSNNNI